jgi:hypothetical protein
MGCFDITKTLCDQISVMVCRYWWNQQERKHKIHWLSWETMIKPKKEGAQHPLTLPPRTTSQVPIQSKPEKRGGCERRAQRARKRGPLHSLMAALQDSASKDRSAKRSGRGCPGGGGEPKQKRARSLSVSVDTGGGGSSAPATAPASTSRARPESAAALLVDVTVEDADALDCGVCFLPLKPPIFQVLRYTRIPSPDGSSEPNVPCICTNNSLCHFSQKCVICLISVTRIELNPT